MTSGPPECSTPTMALYGSLARDTMSYGMWGLCIPSLLRLHDLVLFYRETSDQPQQITNPTGSFILLRAGDIETPGGQCIVLISAKENADASLAQCFSRMTLIFATVALKLQCPLFIHGTISASSVSDYFPWDMRRWCSFLDSIRRLR